MSGPLSRKALEDRVRQLISTDRDRTCGPEIRKSYARRQHPRFRMILEVCTRYVPDRNARVLDIGRSNLTHLLSTYYRHVTTLGFDLVADDGGHRETVDLSHLDHIVYDLNRSLDPSTWPDVDVPFTLIVCAETIEHLSTAPEFTFAMLSTLLQPGGFILVTTPNAVSVHKRLLMLMGRNPFERLRYYPLNPGDFRQYTQNEVKEMALRIGLDVEECGTVNFLTSRFRSIRLLKRIPGLRDSILAVFSRGQ